METKINKQENTAYKVVLQHLVTKKKDKIEFEDQKTFKKQWKLWRNTPSIGFNYKILSQGY